MHVRSPAVIHLLSLSLGHQAQHPKLVPLSLVNSKPSLTLSRTTFCPSSIGQLLPMLDLIPSHLIAIISLYYKSILMSYLE